MRKIPLTQGKVSIVDDDDYEVINKQKWCAHLRAGRWYAACHKPGIKGSLIHMHRVIMNCPKGKYIDHINGDGLDNRKENLRICTSKQNNANKKVHSDNKYGYKGVSLNKATGKYIVFCNKKYRGLFVDLLEAARAYDSAAKIEYGEFARLNFPEK